MRGSMVPTISEECEAFLEGVYAEQAATWGWAVPAWAWVNILAHGTPDDLRRLAEEGPAAGTQEEHQRWWSAVARLAQIVLDEARRNEVSVATIQATTLCELEAWLLDHDPTAQISAERLTSLVLAILYGHPCAPA